MTQAKRRILIADDDQINSATLAKRLERRGLEVFLTQDPDQIFEILSQKKIELLLLDIVMPKKDGITVLKEIRKKLEKHQLPIIMATALEDSVDIVEAFKLGTNDYITKPINLDVAIARIQTQLSIIDLHKEGVKKQEIEAINAMITTYNHEINTPLTVALGYCSESLLKHPENREKLKAALLRIAEIVKKIEAATKSEVNYDDYSDSAKMLKLK